MSMAWSTIAFAVFLILLSLFLLASHRRERGKWRHAATDQEQVYLANRWRRRVQASALIGVTGLLLLAGLPLQDVVARAAYWSGVLFLTLAIGYLAVKDLLSTRAFYGKLRSQHQAERAALEAELRRFKRRQGNGEVNG